MLPAEHLGVDAVVGYEFVVPTALGDLALVEHHDLLGCLVADARSGEVDQIYRDMSRGDAIKAATQLATDRAVTSGADKATLKTIETEDMPLSYLPGNSLRVRVRMVGDVITL